MGVIRHVLEERSDLTDRRVVMLSDRERDVIGRRQNGLGPIAVGHGFGSAAELLAALLVHSVRELAGLLERRGGASGAAARYQGKERAWMSHGRFMLHG